MALPLPLGHTLVGGWGVDTALCAHEGREAGVVGQWGELCWSLSSQGTALWRDLL